MLWSVRWFCRESGVHLLPWPQQRPNRLSVCPSGELGKGGGRVFVRRVRVWQRPFYSLGQSGAEASHTLLDRCALAREEPARHPAKFWAKPSPYLGLKENFPN